MENKPLVLILIVVIIAVASLWGWKTYFSEDSVLSQNEQINATTSDATSSASTTATTTKSTSVTPTATKTTLNGYIIVGKNIRAFTPCGSQRQYWLTGSATNIKLLEDTYHRSVPNNPNSPVYASIAGYIKSPTVSSYSKNFEMTKILKIDALGKCK